MKKKIKLSEICDIYTSITVHKKMNNNNGLKYIFIPKLYNFQNVINIKIVDELQEKKGFYIVPKEIFDLTYLLFILDSVIFKYTLEDNHKCTNNTKEILKSTLSEFLIPIVEEKELLIYKYTQTLFQISLAQLSPTNSDNVEELLHSYVLKEVKDALVLELYYPEALKDMSIFIYPEWEKVIYTSSKEQDIEREIFRQLFSLDNQLLNSIKKLRVLWKNVLNKL